MSTQRFPTASHSREIARDHGAIHAEITAVEAAVIQAAQDGELSVVVTQSPFTSDTLYYQAWTDGFSDLVRRDQIAAVTQYFTGRGYGVQIQEQSPGSALIAWIINW